MNKIIKTLAITALFCFPGLPAFPQEVNETAATENVQTAQEFGGNVNWWIRSPCSP